jgi:hypothetical protein
VLPALAGLKFRRSLAILAFLAISKIYLLVNTLTPPLPPPHVSHAIPLWRRFIPIVSPDTIPARPASGVWSFFTT